MIPPRTTRALILTSLIAALPSLAHAHGGHAGRATPREVVAGGGVTALISSDVGLHVQLGSEGAWRWVCEDALGYDVRTFALAGAADPDPRKRVWLAGGFGITPDKKAEARPGLWRSTDGGCTWANPTGALADHWISALSVHPAAPGSVVAATAHLHKPNGIAWSDDAGETWGWSNLEGVPNRIDALLRAPSDPQRLYASGGQRVWRSDDGGKLWRPALEGLEVSPGDEVRVLAVDPERPDELYFATLGLMGRRLHLSRDAGATSTLVWTPEQGDFGDAEVVALPDGGRALVVATGRAEVLSSTDGGKTWDRRPLPAQSRSLSPDPSTPGRALLSTRSLDPRASQEAEVVLMAWTPQGVEARFAYRQTADRLDCPEDSPVARACRALPWERVSRGEVLEEGEDPEKLLAEAQKMLDEKRRASTPLPPRMDRQRTTPPPQAQGQPEEDGSPLQWIGSLLVIVLGAALAWGASRLLAGRRR